MSVSPDFLIDGDFSSATPVGPPRMSYPFLINKDKVTASFEQEFWQTKATHSPPDLSISHSPALADFYLVEETEPIQMPGNMYSFSRVYSRIPVPQVTYSTIPINKPAFPTNDYASGWVDSTSSTATANVWSPVIAATVAKFATGGTFTITYKTSTTAALNYNDTGATIAAAINALADVVTDNFTVSVSGLITTGSLTVTDAGGPGTFNSTDFSLNSTSLTPTCIDGEISGGSGTWQVGVARTALTFNDTAHGLSAAQAIRINTTTTGGGTETTVASVVDADNFTVTNASFNPSTWAYYRTLLRTYTPGADRVRVKATTTFYLPGVTSGITTPSDIPIPDVAIAASVLLTLIATSAAGYQTYDADALAIWKGQIFFQKVIQIDMANL